MISKRKEKIRGSSCKREKKKCGSSTYHDHDNKSGSRVVSALSTRLEELGFILLQCRRLDFEIALEFIHGARFSSDSVIKGVELALPQLFTLRVQLLFFFGPTWLLMGQILLVYLVQESIFSPNDTFTHREHTLFGQIMCFFQQIGQVVAKGFAKILVMQ